MAKGELPNTMVIVSDFPAELLTATEDIGGYNVTRKQAMLRVLTRRADGNVQLYSQSLDGSDRACLEAIYDDFGMKPDAGELLHQRIHTDLSVEAQATIIDRLTGVYDRALGTRYGGEWYAGRRPADYRNTYEFVRRQQDLIQTCIDLQLSGRLDVKTMYDMSATMQARFKAKKYDSFSPVPNREMLAPGMLQLEIMQAGREARAAGQSFSACGITLKAEGIDGSSEGQLDEAGYGNKASEEDCEFVSKKCPMCGTKNVKTKVTKTHISGSCGCSKKK
jgi:hypothetical protein